MAPTVALFLFLLIFSLSILTLPALSASLSSVAISYTANRTLICALTEDRSSFLNCTSYPSGAQDPILRTNVSVSAVVGGDHFVCGLIHSAQPSNDTIRCWQFYSNGTVEMNERNGILMPYKRLYNGQPIIELKSGTSNFCGIHNGTRNIECWRWHGFEPLDGGNFSSIAVGEDFLCGLSDGGEIRCIGPDSTVPASVPRGNFIAIAAGLRHACAIRRNGSLDCWGETVGTAPIGEFKSLALGDSSSCALLVNGSVVCWGNDTFQQTDEEFLAIEAKRSVFCGVVTRNYSLICWDNETLGTYHKVFDRVFPGSCTTNLCPCGHISDSGSICSAGAICQLCEPQPSLEISPPPSLTPGGGSKTKNRVAYLVVGCVGTAFGLLTIAGFVTVRYCKSNVCRIHDSGRLDEEAQVPQDPSMPREARAESMQQQQQPRLDKRLSKLVSGGTHLEEFSFEMLLKITNDFSEEHKIGSGSFGSVYRATLEDGQEVAIKRAELTSHDHEKETAFVSELALLSRLNHKNLLRLIGYCEHEQERVLVYEFMPNGTLHEHLHKLQQTPLMSWTARLKVALDAARGIEYLHNYAVPPIIHRDIKSSNILLDSNWTAKVSDFGLSLMGPEDDESHLSLRAAGTVGYMDPEYYRLQQLTTKSDVYSFGVVLLELLTGYRAIHKHEDNGAPRNVVDFAVPYIVSDELHRILDPKLPPPTPNEIEAVAYVGYLVADCVSLEGRDRPTMTEIVNSLERALAACLMYPSFSRSSTRSST